MERSSLRKTFVPIVLGLVVVAVLVFGFLSGDEARSTPDAEDSGGSISIWRCHACAKITGQNWQTCRTVTGRGSEEAARELVTERVCEEASDPQNQCTVNTLDCRELTDGAAKVPAKAAKRD